jgi:hypothetical protein
MAAITDLASLCAAVGFEPEDLLGSTAEDLADLLEEYEVKGRAKIQVMKELRQLAPAAPPPSHPPPSAGAVAAFALPDGGTVEIGEEIGRGAFGVVHRGVMTERSGPKPVAIKRLGRGAQPAERERFIREVRPMRLTTRTAHSEALIVRGTGYNLHQAGAPSRPRWPSIPVSPACHRKFGWPAKGKRDQVHEKCARVLINLKERLTAVLVLSNRPTRSESHWPQRKGISRGAAWGLSRGPRSQIQKSMLISQRCRGAVTVYGAVEHDGEACLVMKLYEGTLADKLARVGSGPPSPLGQSAQDWSRPTAHPPESLWWNLAVTRFRKCILSHVRVRLSERGAQVGKLSNRDSIRYAEQVRAFSVCAFAVEAGAPRARARVVLVRREP